MLFRSDLTLHAGGALQGSIQRWNWTLTGNYDRARLNATVDQSIATDAAQAAISAGGNPFLPITAAGGLRIVNRSQTTTDTIVGNVVANGPVFRLPAGAAQVTVTGDLNRSSSRGGQVGMADTRVRRTLGSGNVSLNLPIASADQGVLAAIGTLNADGAIGVSAVSGYRQLVNSTLSTTWAPIHAIQVTASVSTTQTPPSIERLTSPIVSTPNTPFFDFVRGESRLVTVITGGNPDLGPERRRISALGVSVQPLKSKEFRINIDYTDTVVTGQVSNPGGATPALQAALPERFVRNAAGQLQQADLRPFALARERDRALRATVSLFETLGSKPGFSEEASDDPTAVSSASAELARPMIFAFAVFTRRLEDRLTLRPGQPELDLLNGETLNGSGGRPRYEAQGSFGGSYGPVQASLSTAWQAPTRIRSAIAASDLSFSGKTIIGLEATLNVAAIASMAWVQKLTFQLDIQNLLNDRMEVRDRNGQTPFNFQPNFLDPYGRIIRFGLRKLF